MRLARQKEEIHYGIRRVYIFPDCSPSLQRLKGAFKDVKKSLRERGIAYSLHHPAKLWITHEGNIRWFASPSAAADFLKTIDNNNCSSSWAVTTVYAAEVSYLAAPPVLLRRGGEDTHKSICGLQRGSYLISEICLSLSRIEIVLRAQLNFHIVYNDCAQKWWQMDSLNSHEADFHNTVWIWLDMCLIPAILLLCSRSHFRYVDIRL